MPVNERRGEIAAALDGREYRLCLTLGALAELETALGVADLSALADRLGEGRIAARDMLQIIAAGLRGAGHAIDVDDVAQMRVDDGALGYARITARLLAATFRTGEAS